MFDQILNLVKEHLGGNQQVASAIPPGQEDAVHNEIANHVTQGLASQAAVQGGVGGLLSKLQNSVSSGGPVTSAIEGGLVSSLASKFGLSPMVTGAIAGMLPGLLQKFAHKANDPNDNSVTPDSITKSLGNISGGGGLGSLFGR
jgi:uncharacterized protein YidB (DUF937 family)